MDNFDNYEVTSIIGSGSFGTCYKVKHKTSSEEYVWKAVNYGHMSEEKKELLVSEVNLLSKLQHPNIVKYHNHIIHHKSSTLYIIMECCSGGDLSQIINRCLETSQFLDELFIWRLLYQLSLALDVCHSQCAVTVLHRDIKPANVFLDSQNNVKLGDFGLAKILEEKQNFTSTVVGTPLYMSPEVIRHKKYNNKSDIWALGCLIYEACSLKPPFMSDDMNHLSSKITEGKFDRIPNFFSHELQKMIYFLLNINSKCRPTVDVILRHPTVLSKSSKPFKSIYRNCSENETQPRLDSDLESKFSNNLQIRLESIRKKETALKIKEEKLNEKEKDLIKREKKVFVMERLANDKILRANLFLKRSRESTLSIKSKSNSTPEDVDSSFSADPGDNSILPTSTKIDEEAIVKPKGFVRSKSERRVHFNRPRVFESQTNDVILKQYNFFEKEPDKLKKKRNFGTVLRALNSKISQSSSSLGSSKSSSASSETTNFRPLSWTEENKKCAFSLLKLMNAECDKENIHSKITHTKL